MSRQNCLRSPRTSPRRANHEGHVRQRPDGRWEIQVTLAGRRRSFYGLTRKEVVARVREAQHTEAIVSRSIGKRSLSGWMAEWLEGTKPHVAFATWRADKGRLEHHIAPAFDTILIEDLTVKQVQDFLALKAETLSDQTVRHLRGLMRRALNDAIRQGLLDRNMAALAKLPKGRPPAAAAGVWTPDECRKFLAAINGEPLRALWLLLLAGGLRRSEALGLAWGSVDLEAGTVRVVQTLQRTDQGRELLEVKSQRSRRTVALPALAVEALAWQRSGAGVVLPTALVFTAATGEPLDPRNVNRSWERLLVRHSLRRIRLHDLRHSYASLLISLGASPREAMEALGHSSITVTMDRYGHLFDEAARKNASNLDRLLRS